MLVNRIIQIGITKSKINTNNLYVKVDDLIGIIPAEQLIIELLIGITEYPCSISNVTKIPNKTEKISEYNASLLSKLL